MTSNRNEHFERRDPGRVSARRGSLAALGVLGAVTLTSSAMAQATSAPVGTFGLRANGGALHSVQTTAVPGADAGTVRFVGSAVDPAGAWEASWDYIADLDPNGNAKLNGVTSVLNKSDAVTEFDIAFEVPICPFIQSGSKMGGSCVIKLTTNANGGAVSTGGGNAVFSALADGASGSKLFHGPFNMGSTGSGTAQTANVFGAPFPAADSAAISSDFGLRHVFKLTDGDTVLITGNLVVGGEPANFVSCQPQAQASVAAPAMAPAASVTPSMNAVGNGPSTSAVTLGASNKNKVTIAADTGKKKPAASRASKPKTAASPSRTARKPLPTRQSWTPPVRRALR